MTTPLLRPASTLPLRRVLITGASGFVAASLIRRLLNDGHEVHALVRARSDLWRLAELRDRLTFHTADLADAAGVNVAFQAAKPEWVFHLATARGEPDDFDVFLHGNIIGAANLISGCRRYRPDRLIVFGSSLEYGHRDLPLREDMALAPSSLHGSTKACASLLFQQAHRSEGLPVTVLRLFSVFGPWEGSARLLPKAILAGLEGRDLHLTPPGIRRDYVFVDDVVEASLLAVATEATTGEIINVGTGIQTTNEDLVAAIDRLTNGRMRIVAYDYPVHDTDANHWVGDMRKCRTLLKWTPPTTLGEGLRTTLDWIQQHRHLLRYA